jgi:hypothetical protein
LSPDLPQQQIQVLARLLRGIDAMTAAQRKGASALFGNDGVFADGNTSHQAGRDFDLRGRDDFVRAFDAWNTPAHQLRGTQTRDYDELERIRAVRTLNHETFFFLAALVRLEAGIVGLTQESGTPIVYAGSTRRTGTSAVPTMRRCRRAM